MYHFAAPLLNGKSRSMNEALTLKVAEFSSTPFGRYREDGPESGQVFREDVLLPALAKHRQVIIDVDGVAGLPSSFWEEALGGLIRSGLGQQELEERLRLTTSDPSLDVFTRLGWRYIREAASKQGRH